MVKTWTAYSSSLSFKTVAAAASIVSTGGTSNIETVNSTIKVYPNPSRGQFVVELHIAEKISADAKIQLLDMTGKTVYTGNAVMNNGSIQKTITAPSILANGIYMVRVIVHAQAYKTQLVYTI